MQRRKLGDSDLEVSEIALGSWLTYSGGIERDQAEACTRAAYEAGINFFDTANSYGRGASEEAWGDILSIYPRDSYVLATKVYFPMSDTDPETPIEETMEALSKVVHSGRARYIGFSEWMPDQIKAGLAC